MKRENKMKFIFYLCLLIGLFFAAAQLVLFRLAIFRSNWKVKDYLHFSLFEADIDQVCKRSTYLCPTDSKAGPIQVLAATDDFARNHLLLKGIAKGGRWRPCDCLARFRVAVIVPYEDKLHGLSVFLRHMHPFLQRQNLDYTIFVVEQTHKYPFNKGALANIGFREVITREGYDCFIFNDLLFLPEDDRIQYTCADHPRHLSAACSRWNYKLKYDKYFGGVQAFDRHQLQKVNGFSNAYYGREGVEDDLYARVENGGYKVQRYPLNISRFFTLDDKIYKEGQENTRGTFFNSSNHSYLHDGLNSLKYNILWFKGKPLFTHIMVELDMDSLNIMTTSAKGKV